MSVPAGHRKRVKHFNEPGHCHELTFSCYRRMPLLTNDTWRTMLSRAIDRAMVRHKFRLVAFVYMPEHMHLLVLAEGRSSKVDALLKAIKRPYSYRIKKQLEAARSPLLARLTIRQRPGVETFRYWQEGPGYDRNISSLDAVEATIEYIHNNPVRRGLCKRAVNWRWSSARHYYAGGSVRDAALPLIHGLPAAWLDAAGE